MSTTTKKSTNNTVYYIITNNFNWADEIDFEGFVILTEKNLLTLKNKIQKLIDSDDNKEISIGVGSNEDIDTSYKEILEILNDAEKISDDAINIFKKYLGLEKSYTNYIKYEYGHNMLCGFIDQML